MPRYSKKRGKQSAYRGISHHKAAIVCATDENDHMMMQVSVLEVNHLINIKRIEITSKMLKSSYQIQRQAYSKFANYLEAVNNKIKTSPIEKRYLTDDGKSLGSVNEMMTEVSSMIQTTRGVGNQIYTRLSRFSAS